MKSAIELFKECAEVVNTEYECADASEQLRAALALTGLAMQGDWTQFNQAQQTLRAHQIENKQSSPSAKETGGGATRGP